MSGYTTDFLMEFRITRSGVAKIGGRMKMRSVKMLSDLTLSGE